MLGDIWSDGHGNFYIDMCNPDGIEQLTIGIYPDSTKKVNYLAPSKPEDFISSKSKFLVGNIVDILYSIKVT